MEVIDIRSKIKEIITNTTSIPPERIGDTASLKDDLELDSLTLLEIALDVDHAFGLQLPEERLEEMATVQDAVDLVQHHLAGV